LPSLVALTIAQVDTVGREITVDRKVVEVAGHLFAEAPKGRKRRRTVYPAAPRPPARSRSGSPPLAWRLRRPHDDAGKGMLADELRPGEGSAVYSRAHLVDGHVRNKF